jgi:RNA polymerase sigma factor (sigma-70 family)
VTKVVLCLSNLYEARRIFKQFILHNHDQIIIYFTVIVTTLTKTSSNELIKKFNQTQQVRYFNALYYRHANLVFGKALQYLENYQDASELSQNIWVKVYFNLHKFKFESEFTTWLFTIQRRETINYIKNRKAMFTYDKIEKFELEAADKHMEQLRKKIDVTKALNTVSKEMRVILILKFIDGLTYHEISKETGIGVSALKMQIKRFKDTQLAT